MKRLLVGLLLLTAAWAAHGNECPVTGDPFCITHEILTLEKMCPARPAPPADMPLPSVGEAWEVCFRDMQEAVGLAVRYLEDAAVPPARDMYRRAIRDVLREVAARCAPAQKQ